MVFPIIRRYTNHQSTVLYSYCRDSARRRSLRRSRSLKVTDFGTNQKPVCHFVIVNNANLHLISQRLQFIAQQWWYFRFWNSFSVISVSEVTKFPSCYCKQRLTIKTEVIACVGQIHSNCLTVHSELLTSTPHSKLSCSTILYHHRHPIHHQRD